MITIIINNLIELETSEEITYNFQSLDVSELNFSKSNYTSTFKIPKTHENVRAFEGLGLASDISDSPYVIQEATVNEEGVSVYKGNLIILKTDKEYYHCSVVSGTFDFYNILGDINLQQLGGLDGLTTHAKTVTNVGDRLLNQNLAYFYFLAYFGDNMNTDSGSVNVDSMAPAVSLLSLMNAIFNSAGYTFNLPQRVLNTLNNPTEGVESLVIPYPPYLQSGAEGVLASQFVLNPKSQLLVLNNWELSGYRDWNSENIISSFEMADAWQFRCTESGEYVFNLDRFEVIGLRRMGINQIAVPVEMRVYVNGNRVATIIGPNNNTAQTETYYRAIIPLNSGDLVNIGLFIKNRVSGEYNWSSNIVQLSMFKTQLSVEGGTKTFGIKLKDIVKEFCWRYALIATLTNDKHIDFITLEQHLSINHSNSVDWSNKYIDREESYDIGYAVNNLLKHSYIEDGVDYYDANIVSENKNLDSENEIVESSIFVPTLGEHSFQLAPPSYTYDNAGGFLIFEQENTNNRYFFARVRLGLTYRPVRLESRTLPGSFLIGDSSPVNLGLFKSAFNQNEYWRSLENILINPRLHIINLHLSLEDIRTLDLTKQYWFDQEQSYYVLKSLKYTKGSQARGEFIKINNVI